jgi:putative PIN family toxin of toxin-antitoxin system
VTLPVVIVDTNVIVSGILTGASGSPTAAILDGMLRGAFTYLLSLDLLGEYREALLRRKIHRRHGLGGADVEAILTELALNGSIRDPPPVSEALPDFGDRHLFALLNSDSSAILVTGDEKLIKHAPEPDRLMSPRSFLALMQRSR